MQTLMASEMISFVLVSDSWINLRRSGDSDFVER